MLLGPSATGKSTVIGGLMQQGLQEFSYVKPIMTRPNRPGETDKISVGDEAFDAMEADGQFVIVNNLYGVKYGTPLRGILDPLETGQTPVLDYPLSTADRLLRTEYDTLNVYVYPPSVEAWVHRVESSGRNAHGRLEAGLDELTALERSGYRHPAIDISVVNRDGMSEASAQEILAVLDSIE